MKVIFPTILVTLVGAVRIIPIFLPPQCWFLRVGITKLKQKIQHWEGKSTTFCRNIACVASVSVWFRSKERPSMVFDFCPLFFAPKPHRNACYAGQPQYGCCTGCPNLMLRGLQFLKIVRNGRLNAGPAQANCHNGRSLLSVISVVRLRLKREPFLTCFSPEAYRWFRNLCHLGFQKRPSSKFFNKTHLTAVSF